MWIKGETLKDVTDELRRRHSRMNDGLEDLLAVAYQRGYLNGQSDLRNESKRIATLPEENEVKLTFIKGNVNE